MILYAYNHAFHYLEYQVLNSSCIKALIFFFHKLHFKLDYEVQMNSTASNPLIHASFQLKVRYFHTTVHTNIYFFFLTGINK